MTETTGGVYGGGKGTPSQFDLDVKRFVLERLENPDTTVTCPSLAAEFIDEFLAAYGPLGLWNVAAYIGVTQTIRPLLRKKYPEAEPSQIDLELPETALLQARYSVLGAATDGEPAYVPRHKLSKDQMESIVARDRAMSAHFARRADALESWWYRNNDGSAT